MVLGVQTMAKRKPKPIEKKYRYFAKCTYCRQEYKSDEMIKACCNDLAVNDGYRLTSTIILKEIK